MARNNPQPTSYADTHREISGHRHGDTSYFNDGSALQDGRGWLDARTTAIYRQWEAEHGCELCADKNR